jgi:hypothetical protein
MFTNLASTSFLDPLEWIKWVFVAAYVVSTIGVTIGVYWEGDQFEKSKQQRGWRLLILSLAADTLFTILIFATDGWISRIQRQEIIALEKRLAARTLSDVQATDMKSKLQSFSGQVFQVVPYWQNRESFTIADRIARTLIDAGWKIEQPQNRPSIIGVMTGVFIYVDHGASEGAHRAARELTAVLNASEIQAIQDEENNPNPSNNISIQIGIKP